MAGTVTLVWGRGGHDGSVLLQKISGGTTTELGEVYLPHDDIKQSNEQ